ncbi:LacI family DNA-binding transcriptional regulator [Mucilaginibacter aquaedulcis]|uniref:LacI family DNA-binding transcriptional regulator n=1 Tax=Mucilaginibacter aquaedulcis TaxID=1187081 RepID=UPI0025B5F4A5|nr:substrate-binding domain-containing protein [Mucilaginibacter aquaedulcis]MDN3548527.1 substrate-binding domain-containing protein [Mucilaginibacter aquaedulcis]
MKKKLSIVDIANSLNISKTTVSFILNGRAREKRISEELVDRVLKYVKEVGYKPNSLAKSLRTGKSNIIGLLVEDISNTFFASIARQIEERAYKNGYKIIYSSTDNDTQKTQELIAMFRDRHVDGYIIVPPQGIEEDISGLIRDGLPVVLFDRHLPEVETDYVLVDNLFSTYNATRYLVDKGYKNVAFISIDAHQSQMIDRLDGYKKAMNESKLNMSVLEVDFFQDKKLMINQIADFLNEHPDTDSILFGNNRLATCGLKALRNLNKRVPEDIALISFDDYEVFELSNPPVTAIAQPIDNIADQVITILLNRLNTSVVNNNKQHVILPTDLKVRKST